MGDSKLLNGLWVQTYLNEDCAENPSEFCGLSIFTEMDEGAFTVRTSDGQVVLKGTYVIDANARPPQIDWTDSIGEDSGKTFPSVYRLTKYSFEFCAADEGMARPTSIGPAKGHTIRRFRRVDENA